jgi:hypothetical protein
MVHHDIIIIEFIHYLVACEATFSGGTLMFDKRMLEELQEFLDIHLNRRMKSDIKEAPDFIEYTLSESIQQNEIEDFIKINRKPTLQKVLFDFIDKKAGSDAAIYKKAGIDRKHFSKIRSNPNYRPSKNTIIALALALELSKNETNKLLGSAGYSLSDSDTSDLIVQFCLEKKIYDIDYVNQTLDYFSLKPLSGMI